MVGAGHRAACDALRLAYHGWLELGPVAPPVAPRDPLVEAVKKAMNGSEWIDLGTLGNNLIENGHPLGDGGFRVS